MSRSLKDKLVNCIAINLAKQKYGDANKKAEFVIEAEMMLKTLLLQVLVEKSKSDPYNYVEMLENVEEIMDLDYYDMWFIESLVLGN